MNSFANRSSNTNQSQVSHQAIPSEQAIHQSDVDQSISRQNNNQISEGPVNPINESSDENMAKEFDRANETLALTDTKPLNSPESNDLEKSKTDATNDDSTIVRQHPIASPSEPKQYRAIGLVRGRYKPSTEQFTRGNLETPDGAEIDAVLLGRVMSLLKNHLDLETEHLWVVYPRTRQENNDLHIQIMGVWEPETLRKSEESQDEPKSEESSSVSLTPASEDEDNDSQDIVEVQENLDCSDVVNAEILEDNLPGLDDGYFSIRGEVIYQSQDEEYVIVKVRQSPRKDEETPRFFKLKLKGNLGDRPIHRFWDLHIQRQETFLVIQYGNDIGALFLNEQKPQPRGNGRFNQKRTGNYSQNSRPQNFNSRKSSTPIPKPIKKKKSPEN
ncbi:MAG: hypothetical protein WBA93_34185 [Microcoleaceae cyanobacterium]